MPRKGLITFLTGVIVGISGAYFAYKKREELLEKLQHIQGIIENSDLPDKTKHIINEIVEKLKNILSSQEEITEEEKKDILKEVEEKIKELEKTLEDKED